MCWESVFGIYSCEACQIDVKSLTLAYNFFFLRQCIHYMFDEDCALKISTSSLINVLILRLIRIPRKQSSAQVCVRGTNNEWFWKNSQSLKGSLMIFIDDKKWQAHVKFFCWLRGHLLIIFYQRTTPTHNQSFICFYSLWLFSTRTPWRKRNPCFHRRRPKENEETFNKLNIPFLRMKDPRMKFTGCGIGLIDY